MQVSASSNFFADVPADDWSYSAVNELIATGHVADYTEPIPQGRIMSRLEMAMIVDAAQQNLSTFTSDEKALEQQGEDFTSEEKKENQVACRQI